MKCITAVLLSLLLTAPAMAHKASDAYLRIEQTSANGPAQMHFSVALRDLDRELDLLDANNDREITAGEVKTALPQIAALAQQSVALRCEGRKAALNFSVQSLEQRSDGIFVRLAATAPACELERAQIRYSLMQGIDADHRAILSLVLSSGQSSRVLAPAAEWTALNQDEGTLLKTLGSFAVLGIEHIGSGADHIAFVICLVLGLTLTRAWKALLITVTAFTLGHSVTLIAATLGWVGSPAWVEPVIAASIAVAALPNLFQQRAVWMQSLALKAAIAAGFGLVHGLGFSGAMAQAQVPAGTLPWALAGFNIGVEIGQLLIIGLWSIVYFTLRQWQGYPRWVVQAGSIVLMALSSYWVLERIGLWS